MPTLVHDGVTLNYEVAGEGPPLLLIPGGGLDSSMAFWRDRGPFNAMEEFRGDFRCITMDLRNAMTGKSHGPLLMDDPWRGYAEDYLVLLDHLGVEKFSVMGFCIGGPLSLKLIECAPDRVVSAVLAQPSGFRPELPDYFWDGYLAAWGPRLCGQRSDVTMDMVREHLQRLYRANPDFVFSVTRDFVRSCDTPMLVLPDDVPAHPFQLSMELYKLAPNAEVSHYPWTEPSERLQEAIGLVRKFLSKARVPDEG